MCVREHTVASLGVLSLYSPSLNISLHPATGAFCASCVCVCECVCMGEGKGGSISFTPQMSVRKGGQCVCFRPQIGGAPGETVSGPGLPIRGCVGVLWIWGGPAELPTCFPAVMAASIRGFAVSAWVWMCLCLCFLSLSVSLLCSGFSTRPAVAVFHPSLPATPGISATGIWRAGGEELASLHGCR